MLVAESSPQYGCLAHFPASGPDEHISSRVVRYHIKSGHSGSQETFKKIFGKPPFALNHLVIPHLRRLAEKLPGDVEHNLAELEKQGTLLPLCEQFNRRNSFAAEAHPENRPMKRVVGDPAATRICVDCLIEDEREHGFPYLHRSHQIPGTTACWRHGRPLIDRCPACGRPYSMAKELVLTAWNGCECGLRPAELDRRIKKNSTKIEVEFANFAKELLTNEPISLSGQDLSELYRAQAQKLGMGWGKHQVNRQKLSSRLATFYGKGFLCRIDPAYRAGKMTGWMKVFEASASFEAPVYRHMLVAFFLFRKYALFRKAAFALLSDREATLKDDSRTGKSPEQESLNTLLKDLATTALRYNFSIKQLWIGRSGAMKRLVKLAPDAVKRLESKVNRMAATRKKASTRGPTIQPPSPIDDQRWSDALIATATELYCREERPRYISANTLLTNTSYRAKGASTPKSDQHPMAYAALKSQSESQWHFYARRILWALQGLSDPQVPASFIVRSAGLEYHKGLAVLDYFVDCPRGVGSSIDLVNQILARKEITRNWLGPCPERVFQKAGRAHQPTLTRSSGKIG
jgi:hypothetical protein